MRCSKSDDEMLIDHLLPDHDVVIIGAGVIGCSVARELSKYKLKVCVLEKEEDVCCGTSKANSAIVHAGFDAKHGGLMAKLNVEGSQLMPALCKELDVPYKQIGGLVVSFSDEGRSQLTELYENGIANAVQGLEIIDADRLRELEPNISDDAVAALWAPTSGIVCPFALTIALAENANTNGVEFCFNTVVTNIHKEGTTWVVQAGENLFRTKIIINAAGVYADTIHNMVSERKLSITPRRGDYMLLDRTAGGCVNHTVFQLPDEFGKGVLVSPTVHGNVLVGPTAIDIEDKDSTSTTAEGLATVSQKAKKSIKNLPLHQVITSFAGLRAHEAGHDFVISEPDDAKGFIDCAGMESPGLSAAPAVGVYVADMVKGILAPGINSSFNGKRIGICNPKDMTDEEYGELIQKDAAYGRIVCRCERITEGEIRDAIRRPLGAKSLDGVKRRTRAGMGRCQAGFCSTRVMQILAEELGVSIDEITKCGGSSALLVGDNKDEITEAMQ